MDFLLREAMNEFKTLASGLFGDLALSSGCVGVAVVPTPSLSALSGPSQIF